jgi:hypothetical protein
MLKYNNDNQSNGLPAHARRLKSTPKWAKGGLSPGICRTKGTLEVRIIFSFLPLTLAKYDATNPDDQARHCSRAATGALNSAAHLLRSDARPQEANKHLQSWFGKSCMRELCQIFG